MQVKTELVQSFGPVLYRKVKINCLDCGKPIEAEPKLSGNEISIKTWCCPECEKRWLDRVTGRQEEASSEK